jgi:hypothetical protein
MSSIEPIDSVNKAPAQEIKMRCPDCDEELQSTEWVCGKCGKEISYGLEGCGG